MDSYAIEDASGKTGGAVGTCPGVNGSGGLALTSRTLFTWAVTRLREWHIGIRLKTALSKQFQLLPDVWLVLLKLGKLHKRERQRKWGTINPGCNFKYGQEMQVALLSDKLQPDS